MHRCLLFIVSSQYTEFHGRQFSLPRYRQVTTYKDIDKRFSPRIALYICITCIYVILLAVYVCVMSHSIHGLRKSPRLVVTMHVYELFFFYTCFVKRIFEYYFPQKNPFYFLISHNKISTFKNNYERTKIFSFVSQTVSFGTKIVL